jgi:lysozyme
MRRAVKVPPTPHEFDALVSFHFNTGGIAAAALTRHLNAGHRVVAAAAFLNWRGPASIILRRESERDLFRHGRYPGGAIPVWSVGRTGRVDFSHPIRRLSEAKALALMRPQSVPVLSVTPTPDVPGSFLSRLAALIANLTRRA